VLVRGKKGWWNISQWRGGQTTTHGRINGELKYILVAQATVVGQSTLMVVSERTVGMVGTSAELNGDCIVKRVTAGCRALLRRHYCGEGADLRTAT
jgi:hypothetical protein